MMNPTALGIAVLTTASFCFASGEGDKKKGGGGAATPTKTSPQGGGWSGSAGGGLKYTGHDFSVKLTNGAQVQFNYWSNDAAVDTARFNIRRARTALAGHIHNENITYKLQVEWNEATAIKDAWLDYKFHNTEAYSIGVRAGQLKPHFGREHNTSWNKFDFIDRALATRTFANRRTRGAMLHGSTNNGGLMWSLLVHNSDLAAAANNSGEEGDGRTTPALNDDGDNELNYTGAVAWTSNPDAVRMGGGQAALDDETGFGFGAAYSLSNGQSNTLVLASNTDTETDTGNLWAQVRGGGFNGLAEFFMREEIQSGVNDVRSSGYQASVSWTQVKIPDQAQWGCGLRYAHIEQGRFGTGHGPRHLGAAGLLAASGREVNELEFVVNMFYHGHKMKTQAGVTHQSIENPPGGNSHTDNYLFSIQTTFTF